MKFLFQNQFCLNNLLTLIIKFNLYKLNSATNGVVIATEKKSPSTLVDETTVEKISLITDDIGIVYSGMGPDARVLVGKARKAAQKYKRLYNENPPVNMLVKEVALIMQEYTQSG